MLYTNTENINSLLLFIRRKKCPKILTKRSLLAWVLLLNMCANIIGTLKKSIHSQDFIINHKTTPNSFTRNRKLPFHNLVLFLLGNLKGSYNRELDRFFQQTNGSGIGDSEITKSAVTIARKYLMPETFLDLNDQTIKIYEKLAPLKTWHGFRLLSIDGTLLRLPNVKEIYEHFGGRSGGQGIPCPMARMSELYDPLNQLTIRGIITSIHVGEREHAYQLLPYLKPNDLLLLDRGYPSFSLFKTITSLRGHLCARMTTHWKVVKDFLSTGLEEQIITLSADQKAINECMDMKLDQTPISMRLLKILLPSGETEILITTLTDLETYPHELFVDLYHQRWFVEEDYKTLKLPLEVENFTGKTVHSIFQDCYAQILAKNITVILSAEARNQIKQKGKKGKFVHQINFTNALSKTKEIMIRLFLATRSELDKLLGTLYSLYCKRTEPVRPGRSFPRNHRIYKRVYHWNRKCIA